MRIEREFMDNAMKQFALDLNIEEGRWMTEKIHLSPTKILAGARMHVKHDTFFKAVIFMGKAYVMADEVLHPWIMEHLGKVPPEWWCDFKNLRKLDAKLGEYGREIFDTHIYYLPAEEPTLERPRYEVKWFHDEELEQFREDERFSTYALSFSPTQPDRLAVAAYEGDNIMGMAGCSEDGAHLWQIGIDVCKEYEGRGLARHLVTLLKQEIIATGKTPYYGTSESHAVSRNIAIGSGFLPAWCEIQIRKKDV